MAKIFCEVWDYENGMSLIFREKKKGHLGKKIAKNAPAFRKIILPKSDSTKVVFAFSKFA